MFGMSIYHVRWLWPLLTLIHVVGRITAKFDQRRACAGQEPEATTSNPNRNEP